MTSLASRLIPLFILAFAAGSAHAEPPPAAPAAADPADCGHGRIQALTKQSPQAAIAACDAALALSTDPKTRADQFQLRAYVRNEAGDSFGALEDLNQAVKLDPSNPAALHERAYTLNVLGRWEEAIADLEAQLKLQPGNVEAYQERAYAEFPLGRFQDLHDDWTRILEQNPQDIGAFRSRGKSDLWLGRFDDARADFDAADKAANGDPDELKRTATEREKLSLWTDASAGPHPESNCAAADDAATKDPEHAYREPHLIGDCTRAYLAGKTPKEKAAALVIRSQAWMFLRNDENDANAIDDAVIAVALEPDNAVWRSNLGFGYLGVHHSWAAIQQFDKSIALKPTFYAYGGRAAAKYNRKDYKGSFEDAKKSFEMQPNELALTVLGDLSLNYLHDPKTAKSYWMGAYHLGDRDDGLMARLKSVGVDDPAKEPQDPPAKK